MAKAMRYSRQREEIYACLLASGEHPTAEMIHRQLKEALPDLSLGTVYRNLKQLEEMGKVRRVASHQGNERYDAICGDHVHFVCGVCGAVTDVAGADARELLRSIVLEEGFRPEKTDMIVTGRCPLCSGLDEPNRRMEVLPCG